jgi:hypothetical protein
MNDIALITPPDFLYNDSYSILLICPSTLSKDIMNSILLSTAIPLNVMVYETPSDGTEEIEWLLNAVKIADCVFLDLDNCDPVVRQFASHFIAQTKTFYLTNDNTTPYNLISKSRVYDFAWLESLINRGKNEKTPE